MFRGCEYENFRLSGRRLSLERGRDCTDHPPCPRSVVLCTENWIFLCVAHNIRLHGDHDRSELPRCIHTAMGPLDTSDDVGTTC